MSTQPQSPRVSPALLSLFTLYLHWYVPRHFHALRVTHPERFPRDARPLIACINHPSWWDPLTILMLSQFLSPGRFAYAPMEAEALSHYGFFRKIGAFPVDNTSPRAGAQFLRQANDVLSRPEAILWMTPEGQFTDARRRPIEWKPGTAALTRHLGECTVVPLAIEYTFWDERLPEILCSVGEPLLLTSDDRESTTERSSRLAAAMTAAQEELASRALKRDGSLFTSVFSGSAGVSVTYDVWLRMKSILRGKPYVAEHRAVTEIRSVAHK
jgi:1-acyl-sn-glycerol-3-phosphate acyltransferase